MKNYNILVSFLIGLPTLVLVSVFAIQAVYNRPVQDLSSVVAGASLYEKQEYQQEDVEATIDIVITSSGIKTLDEAVLGSVREFEDNFKKEIAASEIPEDWGMPPTLQIRSSYSSHENIVSAVLDIYSFTGGVHGVPQVQTLAYDRATKQMVTLDEMLGGATFVEIVSNFVVNDLLAREDVFDESIVRDAAGPQAGNFDAWAVGEEGVTIFFDPYEVAPFSAGIIRVTIPWSTIELIQT